MSKIKALLLGVSDGDMLLITEDGSMADIHFDGDHPMSTDYQSRIRPELELCIGPDANLWDLQASGKQYIHDWDEEGRDHKVSTEEFINKALEFMMINREDLELDMEYACSGTEEEDVFGWLAENFIETPGVTYIEMHDVFPPDESTASQTYAQWVTANDERFRAIQAKNKRNTPRERGEHMCILFDDAETSIYDMWLQTHYPRPDSLENEIRYRASSGKKIGYRVLPYAEAAQILSERAHKKFCKDPEKIDEDVYYDRLECLPPMRWKDGVFLISEYMYDNITNFVAKFRMDGETHYYEAMRPDTLTNDKFMEEVKAFHTEKQTTSK